MCKNAPKLPRFVAPKCLMSRTYRTKKDKANSRQNLNRLVKEY